MSTNENIAATVHYADDRADTTYFGGAILDATTFAADIVERDDVVKVTVQGAHGTLTLTHDPR